MFALGCWVILIGKISNENICTVYNTTVETSFNTFSKLVSLHDDKISNCLWQPCPCCNGRSRHERTRLGGSEKKEGKNNCEQTDDSMIWRGEEPRGARRTGIGNQTVLTQPKIYSMAIELVRRGTATSTGYREWSDNVRSSYKSSRSEQRLYLLI